MLNVPRSKTNIDNIIAFERGLNTYLFRQEFSKRLVSLFTSNLLVQLFYNNIYIFSRILTGSFYTPTLIYLSIYLYTSRHIAGTLPLTPPRARH